MANLQHSASGNLLYNMVGGFGLMAECCCPGGGGYTPVGWIDTGETMTMQASATITSSVIQEDVYGGVGGYGHSCWFEYSDGVVDVDVQIWPQTLAPSPASYNCSISGDIDCGGKRVDLGRRGTNSVAIDSTDLGPQSENEALDQTFDCDLTVEYPMRLMAYYRKEFRTAAGGYEWGKLSMFEDKRDLREYDNMQLAWFWFPTDGVCSVSLNLTWSGGNSVVSFNSAGACSHTPGSEGGIYGTCRTAPAQVQPSNWRFRTGGMAPASQAISAIRMFGRSPNLIEDSNTVNITDGEEAGQTWGWEVGTDGISIQSSELYGYTPWNFPIHGDIAISSLCPPYDFDVTVEAKNMGGVNMPEFLSPAPYDGPDPDSVDAYEVITAVAGTPVAFTDNDADAKQWQAQARRYDIAVGRIDNPYDVWTTAMSANVQEYGTQPLIGFAYEPAALDTAGFDKAAWRCCMRLPTANATWDAMRFTYGTYVPLALLTGWTADSGTEWAESISDPGCLKIAGAGALGLTRAIGARDFYLDSGRYLYFKVKASGGAQTMRVTLSAGSVSKYWEFYTGANGAWAEVTLDLMHPDTATGTANDSTRWQRLFSGGAQARTQGDWAWGVDTPVSMELDFTGGGDVTIASIWLLSTSRTTGGLVVAETIPEDVEEFRLEDRKLYNTWDAEVYTYRILTFFPEWRLACDESAGLVMRYGDGGTDYRIVRSYSVQNLIETARMYGRSSSENSLVTVTNLKPVPAMPLVQTTIADATNGDFSYWPTAKWFHNGTKAYNLLPKRYACAATVDVAASVQVDSIWFNVGTTRYSDGTVRAVTAQKLWSGAWSGIAPGSTEVRLKQGSSSVETQVLSLHGYYLPLTEDASVPDGGTYRVEDSTTAVGMDCDSPTQGVIWRQSWV